MLASPRNVEHMAHFDVYLGPRPIALSVKLGSVSPNELWSLAELPVCQN